MHERKKPQENEKIGKKIKCFLNSRNVQKHLQYANAYEKKSL